MKISRIRLAVSGALGLSLAVIALGMATLLDHQDDPALAQSNDLRSQFSPPSGNENPVGSLRTPKAVPREQPTQSAAPAPAPAPAEAAASKPAAIATVTVQAAPAAVATVQADGNGTGQERADGGDHEGEDD